MIRQVSAWGQFWFDLGSIYRVHGCGIYTPLWTHEPKPVHRGRYYSTWFRMTDAGPIYYSVNGDTMWEMMRDGLVQTGCHDLRMKLALLAVIMEDIAYELGESRV